MAHPLTAVVQSADLQFLYDQRFGLSPERWQSLAGKSFWITGAGTGYGQALAVALASAGCRLFLTGRRLEKLQQTIDVIQSCGLPTDRHFAIPAELTNPTQVEAAVARIQQLGGGQLHGVVHAAALPPGPNRWPLLEDALPDWEAMMRLNVTAGLLTIRLALPLMLATGSVRALLFSSGAGWGAGVGFGPYNVSKAALNSLGASLGNECAACFPQADVQINVLEPGQARTEMNQNDDISPLVVTSMALLLLSHPAGGPNGRFFQRDGWHLSWGGIEPYGKSLN